jgi:hypothetical protein
MPIELSLNDPSGEAHARAIVRVLARKLGTLESIDDKPVEGGVATWTFHFRGGEPDTAFIEGLLAGIDRNWNQCLRLKLP